MPPKGWRKNAEGKFPPNKDLEVVSIDEILFPKSTVQKLAKNITTNDNDSMILSKDSLVALQRSATVFASHMIFHARQIAKEADRKTVNSQDILQALERAELSGFVPEVKLKLTTYEHNVELKKKQRAVAKSDEPVAKKLKDNQENAVHTGEEVEEVEDDDETEVNEVEDEDDDMDATEEQDDDDDTKAKNPIAILSKDEDELGGATKEEEDDESSGEENDL